MNDVTRSSQFIVNSDKFYDIHLLLFFKLFSFCVFFSSNCNLFSSIGGPIQFRVFQKWHIYWYYLSLIFCWTICVFRNVFWVVSFCVSFSFDSTQSLNNRSQWFSNVAQVCLVVSLMSDLVGALMKHGIM